MTSCTPEISVVLPVFNAGDYLAPAIESILKQTLTNFEFIIINDGSTDKSASVIQGYADADDRIVFIDRDNQGLVRTLNEGIEISKAPLIARMDADDVSLPDRFARQYDFLMQHADVVCIGTRVRVIDGKSRYLIDNDAPMGHDKILLSALQGVSPIIHPSAMVRKSALKAVGGYQEKNYPAEDLALWIDLSEVGKIENMDEVLLEYRIHDNSVSSSRHKLQIEKTYEICRHACEKRGLELKMKTREGRPRKSRLSKYQLMVKHGWWAFSSNQWRTAASYSFDAIICIPYKVDAWRLLFCSFFRRRTDP